MPGLDSQINARIIPLQSALTVARDRVANVRRALDIGSSNQPTSGPLQRDCVTRMRKFNGAVTQMFWSLNDLRAIANSAIRSRCGNCGESAAIALIQCLEANIQPLDYMECAGPNDDHAFVVIGRREDSDPSIQDARWGQDAVVCDPWMNIAYPCYEMASRLCTRTQTFRYRSLFRYRAL